MASSKLTYDAVLKWSNDDVIDWAEQNEVDEAVSYFMSNEINGKELLQLDEQTIRSNIGRINPQKLNKLVQLIKELQKMPPPLQPRTQQEDCDEDFEDSFDDDDDAIYDNDPNAGNAAPPPPSVPRSAGRAAPPQQSVNRATPSDEDDDDYLDPKTRVPPVTTPSRPPPGNAARPGARQPPLPPVPLPVTESQGLYEDSIKQQEAPNRTRGMCPTPSTLTSNNTGRSGQGRQAPPPPPDDQELYEEADAPLPAPPQIQPPGRGPVPALPNSNSAGKKAPPPPEQDVYEVTDEKPQKSNNPPAPRRGAAPPPSPPPNEDGDFYEEADVKPLKNLPKSNMPTLPKRGLALPPPPVEDEDFYEEADAPVQTAKLPPRQAPTPSNANKTNTMVGRTCPAAPPSTMTLGRQPAPPPSSAGQQSKANTGPGKRSILPPTLPKSDDIYEPTDQETHPEDDDEYQVPDHDQTPPPKSNMLLPPKRGAVPPPPPETDEVYEETDDMKGLQSTKQQPRNNPLPNRGQPTVQEVIYEEDKSEDIYEESDDQPPPPPPPAGMMPPAPRKPPSIPDAQIAVSVQPARAGLSSPLSPKPLSVAVGFGLDKEALKNVKLIKVTPNNAASKENNIPIPEAVKKIGDLKKVPPEVIPKHIQKSNNNNQAGQQDSNNSAHPDLGPPGGLATAKIVQIKAEKVPPGAPPSKGAPPSQAALPGVTKAITPGAGRGPAPKPFKGGIDAKPWFFHDLTRDQANEKVQAHAKKDRSTNEGGSFLVRLSQKSGQPYTLCVMYKEEILNIQIRQRPDKKFALGSAKADENVFDAVEDMIKFHQNNPIEVSSKGLHGKVKLTSHP